MKRIAMLVFALAFAAPAVGVLRLRTMRSTRPGCLVNAGQTKLNFYCTGVGSPPPCSMPNGVRFT